jgi:hypothetical protein
MKIRIKNTTTVFGFFYPRFKTTILLHAIIPSCFLHRDAIKIELEKRWCLMPLSFIS